LVKALRAAIDTVADLELRAIVVMQKARKAKSRIAKISVIDILLLKLNKKGVNH
jgi:hypothetical protein